MQVLRFGLVLGLLMGAGCLDSTAPADNDGQWTPPANTGGDGDGDDGNGNTGGNNTGGGNTGGNNTGGNNTGGNNTGGNNTGGDNTGGNNTGGDNTGGDNTGGGDTDGGTGGGDGDGDGDGNTGPSALEQIAGTGTKCLTYQPKEGDKCAGVYCGINQALLEQALSEIQNFPNDCGSVPADLLCNGTTVTAVAACARDVKSKNLGKSNAEIRPLVQECVYKNAEIQAKMPPACLGCYLTSAECSGDKCLLQCLGGDSPTCDKCRLDNGCSRPVAQCTGFPDPL